jgi:hypothetical protein
MNDREYKELLDEIDTKLGWVLVFLFIIAVSSCAG